MKTIIEIYNWSGCRDNEHVVSLKPIGIPTVQLTPRNIGRQGVETFWGQKTAVLMGFEIVSSVYYMLNSVNFNSMVS